MPSNQIPEDFKSQMPSAVYLAAVAVVADVRGRAVQDHHLLSSAELVDAIAPLIIEWARKDQAEVDAQIAGGHHEVSTGIRSIKTTTFPDDGHRVADAIRAQFAPETTGGKTNG